MKTSPECYVCSFQFMLLKSFERHIQQMHVLDLSALDEPCALCNTVFSSPRAFVRHLRSEHQLERDNTLKQYAVHRFHLLNRQKMPPQKQPTLSVPLFCCQVCSLSFSNKDELCFHLKEKRRRTKLFKTRELRQMRPQLFDMDIVEEKDIIEQFLNENQPKNTKKIHVSLSKRHSASSQPNIKTYYCQVCDVTKVNAASYQLHLRQYHPENLATDSQKENEKRKKYYCHKCNTSKPSHALYLKHLYLIHQHH
ncbi:hypothetical protein BD560DRAFT_412595 [Blakeslea trispora]|nr:hypothetical protein BD560DRAFT_412595 [Blakeslea trispora]